MSNWYDRAKKGLQGIYEDTYESMSDIQRQRETGKISYTESSIRQLGEVAGGVSSVVDAGLSVIPGYEELQETIGEGVQTFLETPVGQPFARYPQQRPRVSGMLSAGANIAEVLPFVKGVSTVRGAEADLKQLTGPESDKGMLLASLDNYIPGHYGYKEVTASTPLKDMSKASEPLSFPLKVVESQLTNPESLTNKLFSVLPDKLSNLIPEEVKKGGVATKSALIKTPALIKFGTIGGLKTIRDLFSPESRALYREQGLSKTGRNIIASHVIDKAIKKSPEGQKIYEQIEDQIKKFNALEKKKTTKGKGHFLTEEHRKINEEIQRLAGKLSSREDAKAVAEAIYQLHIGQQAGRKGGLNFGLQEITREAFLETYDNYQRGTLSSWFSKHNNRAKSDKYDLTLTDQDLVTLEQDIIKAHKQSFGDSEVPAIVVMKQPQKVTTGQHQLDITKSRVSTQPAGKIKKAFFSLGNKPTTIKQLEEALRNQNLIINSVDSTNGKIYFSGSATGSAIVEGGTHVSGFVKPDGTASFIMSDVHDFFEKTPGTKQVIRQTIPHSLLAVSPVVFKNFIDEGKITNRTAKPTGETDVVDVEAALKDIATAQPSKEVLTAERRKQKGMLTAVAQPGSTLVGNLEEEENR